MRFPNWKAPEVNPLEDVFVAVKLKAPEAGVKVDCDGAANENPTFFSLQKNAINIEKIKLHWSIRWSWTKLKSSQS